MRLIIDGKTSDVTQIATQKGFVKNFKINKREAINEINHEVIYRLLYENNGHELVQVEMNEGEILQTIKALDNLLSKEAHHKEGGEKL